MTMTGVQGPKGAEAVDAATSARMSHDLMVAAEYATSGVLAHSAKQAAQMLRQLSGQDFALAEQARLQMAASTFASAMDVKRAVEAGVGFHLDEFKRQFNPNAWMRDFMRRESQKFSQILADAMGPSMGLARQAMAHAATDWARQAEGWQIPSDGFAEAVRHALAPRTSDELRAWVQHVSSAMGEADLAVDEDTSAQLTQEGLQERATVAMHEIVATAQSAGGGSPNLEQLFDRVVLAIRATREPALQKWLWLALLPFIFMVLNWRIAPEFDFNVKKELEAASSKQEANKAVKKAGLAVISEADIRREFRFVSTQVLWVRAKPGAKARVVGQLSFGNLVRLVEKDKDFALVAWRSDDGKAELQGWVFSRYLRRFD